MKQMVSALINDGFRIWLYDPTPFGFSDNELERIDYQKGGGDYLRQTRDAVRDADAVLFLISHWTLGSRFQMAELSIARKHGRLVPYIVTEHLSWEQLPKKLRRLHVMKGAEQSLSKQKLRMLVRNVASASARKGRLSLGWLIAGGAAGVAVVALALVLQPPCQSPVLARLRFLSWTLWPALKTAHFPCSPIIAHQILFQKRLGRPLEGSSVNKGLK
jgi:hypothetical protein